MKQLPWGPLAVITVASMMVILPIVAVVMSADSALEGGPQTVLLVLLLGGGPALLFGYFGAGSPAPARRRMSPRAFGAATFAPFAAIAVVAALVEVWPIAAVSGVAAEFYLAVACARRTPRESDNSKGPDFRAALSSRR